MKQNRMSLTNVTLAAGIPVPKANARAAKGAAAGGASGVLAAALLGLGPAGLVILAMAGAGIGAHMGNEREQKKRGHS